MSVLLFPVSFVQKSSISTSFAEALIPIYLSRGFVVGRPIFADICYLVKYQIARPKRIAQAMPDKIISLRVFFVMVISARLNFLW